MYVTLHIRKTDGKVYKYKNTMKVSEARKFYKNNIKNDDDVVECWLVYFDGWRSRRHKTLKDLKDDIR